MKYKPVTDVAFFQDVFNDFTIIFGPHSCFLSVKFGKKIRYINIKSLLFFVFLFMFDQAKETCVTILGFGIKPHNEVR